VKGQLDHSACRWVSFYNPRMPDPTRTPPLPASPPPATSCSSPRSPSS